MIGLGVMGYGFAMNFEGNGYIVTVTNWEKDILENMAASNPEKDLIISQNLEESHETMRHASGEDKEQIKTKNKRREEANKGMKEEIKDEYQNMIN